MQIETLKVFCDLAETKSFTKAAHINTITQSAVSQQVSALERFFHSVLIERGKKQFRLTNEGEVLFNYSKQILRSFTELQNRLQEFKKGIHGTLRVSCIYSYGFYGLPNVLRQFIKANPTVKVELSYRRHDEVVEDVLGNATDLGITSYPGTDNRLEHNTFKTDTLTLVCPLSHPLASCRSIMISQLSGMKFVGFYEEHPIRKHIDRILEEKQVKVEYVMEFDNIETIKRALEIDAGLAILPEACVTSEIARSSLAKVEIEGIPLFRPLAVVYKAGKVLTPPMNQFINALRS